jgi:hypothetical protein
MLIDEVTYTRVLVEAIDTALLGSEFGVEAWEILRRILLAGRKPTLDEFNGLVDLIDRAADDTEGPSLSVNLELMRLYN